ncbi:MAG: KAP family NTPase [Tissierellales bacterium]|jgi:hypothetical protein|nr:KAP family NTPase [Tissierellales bacterium]
MNDRMNEMRFDTHDVLDRKNQAIKISRILKNSQNYSRSGEGLVVALNSSWGTGKSMFLKMWESEIKNANSETEFPLTKEKTNVLYYNAWENDDYDNAFIPLVAHFNKIFKKTIVRKNLKEESINEFSLMIRRWRKAASMLTFMAGKNIVKKKLGLDKIEIDVKELLNFKQNDFDEYLEIEDKLDGLNFEDIEKQLATLGVTARNKYFKIKKAVEPKVFEDFEGFRQTKEEFKKALGLISEEKKLVVFVDELDRCRPIYAIETLEAIKHFFSVPNVIFVLSVDIEQLSHSIATVYGQNMDAEGYLLRFVDLQFKLPDPKVHNFCKLLNRNGVWDENRLAIIEILFETLELSLREMEKIFKNIELLFDSIDPSFKSREQKFGFYVLILIIRTKYYEYYEGLLNGEYSVEDITSRKNHFFVLISRLDEIGHLRSLYENNSILYPLLKNVGNKTFKNLFEEDGYKEVYKTDYFIVSKMERYFDKYDNLTIAQYIQMQLEIADSLE